MKVCFIDTAGWMMLADSRDPGHRASRSARDTWLEQGGMLMTTDFVMDETLTLIRMRIGLDAAERWWEQVHGSARLAWEWIDPARAEAARHWFFRWRDKQFSFTDCTSFVVMRDRKVRSALTSDRHFAQAGFQLLPARSRRR